MPVDPYKVPLEEAQKWCTNWIDLKDQEEGLAEDLKFNPKEMRAFLVSKKDLLDLFSQVNEAEYVRFYIGLREEGPQRRKVPHLLMVNATGENAHSATDVVTTGDDNVGGDAPVNDFSHPCPTNCDPNSPLYV